MPLCCSKHIFQISKEKNHGSFGGAAWRLWSLLQLWQSRTYQVYRVQTGNRSSVLWRCLGNKCSNRERWPSYPEIFVTTFFYTIQACMGRRLRSYPQKIKISWLSLVHMLTLFYTRGLVRDSCFTCDGSPTIQVFPLIFYIGKVI